MEKPLYRTDLRPDGVPVMLLPPGALEAEFQRQLGQLGDYPFKEFSSSFVQAAKSSSVDWVQKGAVNPAKDQGQHGYCGTFGRVGAAEGQYAIHSGHGLKSFSEEQLVDCIGWDKDQFGYFQSKGFMSTADYPYNGSGPDMDPPIPGHPCIYDSSKVLAGSDNGAFTYSTGRAPSEDQLTAFVYKNGPVGTGVHSGVFGLREKGCDAKKDCFITADMCNDPSVKGKSIDHAVNLVGYGVDPTHGEYWLVKNSWSQAFANDGFIKVARGVSCAHIDCCGQVFTYGDPDKYYDETPSSAACSAHPKCAHLEGDCCPTKDGVMLDCCNGADVELV